MEPDPVYAWTFTKGKEKTRKTETYYQVIRQGKIRTYKDRGGESEIADVTSSFEMGWGISDNYVHCRKLRPDNAQEINLKIQALEKKAQSDVQPEQTQATIPKTPGIISCISPRNS